MDRFEDAKLRIKEGNDLVALIEQYQPLRPRGRTLVSLCPFHAESSPSFTVFRETQHYRCFGCGKYGDVFTWLMERDGLTFRESMEMLAERAGISLEGVFQKGASRETQQRARNAYEALAAVADFFHRSLLTPAGKPAQDYLEGRSLSDAIVPWTLGYHPVAGRGSGSSGSGSETLLQFARSQKLPVDVLEQAGLVRNGREIYAGRLMFPIVDERGRTVAFGGRIVPGGPGSEPRGDYKPPKYLNSPESPFFSKRRVLYGLRAAKQAGERRLVVMEGYTDVIACHLAGFTGAVASLGTAFTSEHARTVERYADQGVVLMFDGDRAGKQAAERAHRELINSRLMVRIALVSDGGDDAKDPADVVLPRAGEDEEVLGERRARFADNIDGAQDAMTVWFRLLRQRIDLTKAVNVEAAARQCATLLEQVEVPVRRAALTEEMARHLAVPAPTLQRLLRDAPRARPANQQQGNQQQGNQQQHHHGEPDLDEVLLPDLPVQKPTLLQRTEAEMLACVLSQPDLLVGLDFDEQPLQVPAVKQLFDWAVEGLAIGRDSGPDLFRYLFARASEQAALQSMLALAYERSDKMKEAPEVLAGIVTGRRRVVGGSVRRDLREQIRQAIAAGDTATAGELQAQLLEGMRRELPRTNAAGEADAEQSAEVAPVARPRPSFLQPKVAGAPPVVEAPAAEAPAVAVSTPEALATEALATDADLSEAGPSEAGPSEPDVVIPQPPAVANSQPEHYEAQLAEPAVAQDDGAPGNDSAPGDDRNPRDDQAAGVTYATGEESDQWQAFEQNQDAVDDLAMPEVHDLHDQHLDQGAPRGASSRDLDSSGEQT